MFIFHISSLRAGSVRTMKLQRSPPEIDSRWNALFLALEVISVEWCKFVAVEEITREGATLAKAAHAELKHFYLLTLFAQMENHNCFHALVCFISFLQFKDCDGFAEKWRRNVSKPWVVCAVCLLPQLNPVSLSQWHRTVAKWMIMSFVGPSKDARCRVAEEVDLLFEGGAQHLWRMNGKTVERYWEKLQLNYLVALSEVLRGIPASSSDVERRFADQSKIHVKSRKCLKEETVSVLMNLRAAQKAVLRKRGWAAVPTDEFNSDVLETILALEVQGQIEHDAKGLKVGDQVVVHFGLESTGGWSKPSLVLRQRFGHNTAKEESLWMHVGEENRDELASSLGRWW